MVVALVVVVAVYGTEQRRIGDPNGEINSQTHLISSHRVSGYRESSAATIAGATSSATSRPLDGRSDTRFGFTLSRHVQQLHRKRHPSTWRLIGRCCPLFSLTLFPFLTTITNSIGDLHAKTVSRSRGQAASSKWCSGQLMGPLKIIPASGKVAPGKLKGNFRCFCSVWPKYIYIHIYIYH